MAPLLRPLRVRRGEYVFERGDAVDGIYFIRDGTAAYVRQQPGADLVYASCPPGSYFGDLSLLQVKKAKTPSVRLFSVKALSDLDLLLLPKSALHNIHARFQPELLRLFKGSATTLARLQHQVKKGDQWIERRISEQNSDTADAEESSSSK